MGVEKSQGDSRQKGKGKGVTMYSVEIKDGRVHLSGFEGERKLDAVESFLFLSRLALIGRNSRDGMLYVQRGSPAERVCKRFL